MTRHRLTYGTRDACKHCDQDIEWHGRAHGWIDRGGNRQCVGSWSDDGEFIKRKTKHKARG